MRGIDEVVEDGPAREGNDGDGAAGQGGRPGGVSHLSPESGPQRACVEIVPRHVMAIDPLWTWLETG
jgi:hypothetical protein